MGFKVPSNLNVLWFYDSVTYFRAMVEFPKQPLWEEAEVGWSYVRLRWIFWLFLFSFKQTVFFHLHILFALELQCSSVVQQLWVRIQDCGWLIFLRLSEESSFSIIFTDFYLYLQNISFFFFFCKRSIFSLKVSFGKYCFAIEFLQSFK